MVSLKEPLTALVSAGYSVQRLTQLARMQIEAAWNELSAAERLNLDTWLKDQQMTTTERAQIEWTYIRATFTSTQQGHPLMPSRAAAFNLNRHS